MGVNEITEGGRYICVTQLERDTWIVREKRTHEPREEDDMVHLDVVERVVDALRAELAQVKAELSAREKDCAALVRMNDAEREEWQRENSELRAERDAALREGFVGGRQARLMVSASDEWEWAFTRQSWRDDEYEGRAFTAFLASRQSPPPVDRKD